MYVRLPQTGCTAGKLAFFIIIEDRQTQQVLLLAGDAMATTIIIDYNSWFLWALSPAKCSTASVCNHPSDSITETVRLEQFDYYNQTQNEVIYVNMENVDFLPQLPPTSFSRARLAHPIVT